MKTVHEFLKSSTNNYNENGKLNINTLVKDYQKTAYNNNWPLLNKETIRQEANNYYYEIKKAFNDKYDREMSKIFYDMYKKGTLNFN